MSTPDLPSGDSQTVRLVLECFGAPSCTVHFEPAGWEYELRADDRFTVVMSVPVDSEFGLEIAYAPDAIILNGGTFQSVHDRQGQSLEI
jgi:hypothetical protein